MFVHEWMRSPAVTVAPDAAVGIAYALMERHLVRRLPVLDGAALVGVVTRSDIEGAPLARPRVADVMARGPIVVAPHETLESAALLMLAHEVSGLPVVDEDRVVGMITQTDIFRALVNILGFKERGARIVTTLKSPDDITDWLRAHGRGVTIRTVVTYPDPASGQWKAVVRLRGRRLAPPEATAAVRDEWEQFSRS